MASDRKGKPGSKDEAPLDFMADDDAEGWAAAIEEWDDALDLPFDEEEPPSPPPHAAAEQPGQDDPLMHFIQGEMEIPEGEGQALGALLGSAAEVPAAQDSPPPADASAPEPDADIGITPDGVSVEDVEVQISARGWEAAAREEAKAVQEEPTPVAAAAQAEVVEEEATPAGISPASTSAAGKGAPVDVDLDGLMDGLDAMEPEPPSAPHKAAGAPQEPPPPFVEVEPAAPAEHPPLEVFDELVPPSAEPDAADEVEAGEVLPAPPVAAAPKTGPQVIPEEIDELVGEEPELEPPEIPERLRSIQLDGIELPERLSPSAPLPAYSDRLTELLKFESGLTDSSARAAEMELLAARTYEATGDSEEALDHYREVLNHQPGHLSAMRALRRLYTDRGESDQVAELLEQMRARVGDEERRALASSQADLLWSRTGDEAGARALLEQDDLGLRGLLIQADLAAAAGDAEELAGLVSGLAQRIEEESVRAPLLVEHARFLEAMGKHKEAQASYSAAGDDACAMEGLIRACSQLGDAGGQAAAMVASASEPGLWSARRLRRAARLATHGGVDTLSPGELLDRAAEMAADDPLILEEQADALRAGEDPAAAVEGFVRLASAVPESTQRALALLDAGVIAEERLGDAERALELFSRAGDVLPESVVVQALAAQLKLVAADPALRCEAHRTLAAASHAEHRSAHHLRTALVLEHELEREEEAAAELVEAVEHDPANSVALASLEQIYRRRDNLDRLAAIMDTAAEATENMVEAAHLRLRSALLYEGPLADAGAAATRYRQVLEHDAGCAPARLGLHRTLAAQQKWDELALSISEEAMGTGASLRAAGLWTIHGDLLAAQQRDSEAEESYRMALDKAPGFAPAALALNLIYSRAGRWGEVAELWSAALDSLGEESPQRKGLLLRIAGLQEFELEDPAAAVVSYEAALAGEAAAPGALDGLLRTLRRAGQIDRLTRELERELSFSTDPAERFAVLIMAGELSRQSGIDWSEVENRYRRALEQVPGHAVGRQALEELYISQTAWQPLSDLYMSDLQDTEMATPRRVQTYERLAALDQQRGDPDSEMLSLASIVDLDPQHVGAHRALQRAHLKAERYRELARATRVEAEHATGKGDATALWTQLGHLLGDHPPGATGDDEDATTERDAFFRAAELDAASPFAWRRLVDVALLSGNQEDAVRFYTGLADAVTGHREAALYLTRAGELKEEDLELLQRALELFPEHLGAIYTLRDRALRAGVWETAYQAAIAEGRASGHRDHRVGAGLLAGEIAHTRLEDAERAAEAYKQALEDDPGNRYAFRHLRRFLEEKERWSELVELLAARASVERSRPRLIELHHSLAQINRAHLGNNDQAKQHLRYLLKIDVENREALADLIDLFEEDSQWSEAASSLIRLARMDKDPQSLVQVFLRLGRIYQDRAPDSKRAIMSLRKVLSLDADNAEALERLTELYAGELDFQKALAMATQLLEQTTDREKRVEILLRVAKLHEDGIKDPHQAAIAYRQALEINRTDLAAIGEVIGFFVRQGDQRSLMIHLDRSVATMRGLLRHDPLDVFAYRGLFKIFGWRKSPDGCFCAAQVLDALGQADPEERAFLDSHVAGVGAPGNALGDPEFDDSLYDRAIPGGFRQVFRLLAEPFAKYFPGDLKEHGATRSDRIADVDHPLRRIGDALARDFNVQSYEIYLLKSKPTALVVENTSPPAILVGKALLHEATEAELQFLLGRSLWMIGRSMILPAFLKREDLEMLVAGIVRQYQPDFQPADAEPRALHDATKKVGRAIPRKLKQELMPFALECSGAAVDLRQLGAAVVHSANRAGLLTCRSAFAALSVLCRTAGLLGLPAEADARVKALQENAEAAELLRFSVSDPYLELRRAMHIATH